MMNERIAALANYPLKGWEINFYKSFKDATVLTPKQEQTLSNIEKRYTSGVSAKRAAWIAGWDDEKRNKFLFAYNLYRDRNLTARKYRIRYNDFFKSVGDPSSFPKRKIISLLWRTNMFRSLMLRLLLLPSMLLVILFMS